MSDVKDSKSVQGGNHKYHLGAFSKKKLKQQASTEPKDHLKEATLDYLQALCPNASLSQVSAVLRITGSVEVAERCIYDACNPDISGYRCLKEEWDEQLAKEKEGSSHQQTNPFEGVNVLLADRARDVFHTSFFSNLSMMRDYNYTIRVFPIDTSEWDKEMLLKPRTLQDVVRQKLSLASEEPTSKSAPNPSFSRESSQLPGDNLQGVEANKKAAPYGEASNATPIAPIIQWLASSPSANAFSQNSLYKMRMAAPGGKFSSTELYNFYSFGTINPKPYKFNSFGEPGATGTLRLHCIMDHHGPLSSVNAEEDAMRSSPTFSREEGTSHKHENTSSSVSKGDKPNETLCTRFYQATQINVESLQKSQATSLRVVSPLTSEGWRDNSPTTEIIPTTRAATEDVASPLTAEHERGDADMSDAVVLQGSENIKFLIEEEKRWNTISRLLGSFSNIFHIGSTCNLVQEIFKRCPSFVKQVDDIMRALLDLVSKEAPGWRLVPPLEEVLVDIPILGHKLISTSEFKVSELVFNEDKCSCEFIENGDRLKIKIVISKLLFHPIQFAFIEELKANKQNRFIKNNSSLDEARICTYTKGVTSGELKVKVGRINITLQAKMLIAFRDLPELLVEEAFVSIEALKLMNSVTRLNLLCRVMNPLITLIVQKGLRDALVGSHKL